MVSIWLTTVKGVANSSGMKKTAFAKRSRFSSNLSVRESLLPILLDPGGAQAGQTMLIDGKLPGQEFVHRQRVAAASLLEGEQAAANRGNDFGLAADYPPFGSGRGQIRNC
jgi:ligand-binding sensor domain-containing protein